MIPVGHLAPEGCWDETMVRLLLDNELYPTGLEFTHHTGYPNTEGCVLVVPGRYWKPEIVNEAIAGKKWVLFFRIGDEEDTFDVNEIEHPNCRFWIQTPRTDRKYPDGSRFIGVGFTPAFNDLMYGERPNDVFLSAQNTHARRNQAFAALSGRDNVFETDGFTKGMAPEDYSTQMVMAKVAPAPAGAVCPDSFRLWEALEAGCIPIADDFSPTYDSTGFWELLCPGAPFPVIRDYECLPGYIEDSLSDYPRLANRIQAWWMQEKRRMALNLRVDLEALGAC